MKNLAFFNKRSVVFTWLMSYILILFVPIFITGTVYIKTEKIIANEINQSNSFLLGKVQQRMDNQLKLIEKISFEAMVNQHIQEIARNRQFTDPPQSYAIVQAVRDLKLLHINNTTVFDIYVYFKDTDTVISLNTTSDSKTFYSTYYGVDEEGYSNWLDTQKGIYNGSYLSMTGKNEYGQNSRLIGYFRSLPYDKGAEKTATLVIVMKEAELMKDASGIDITNKGIFQIIDSGDNIIASTGDYVGDDSIKYEKLSGKSGIIDGKFNGERAVISYISSDITEWKYVLSTPAKVFWEKADYSRNLFLIALLSCLLLGGALSCFLVRKNYSPLSILVRYFKDIDPLNFGEKVNEYSFLHEAIKSELEERKKLNYKIEQQNKVLKNSFISDLMKGKTAPGVSSEDLLDSYHMNFNTEYFAVMAFYFENIEDFIKEDRELNYLAAYKMVQFILTNVVEELVNRKNTGFMAEVDDLMVCLINLNDTDIKDYKAELARVATEATEFIEKNYKIHFITSASNVHETVAGIREAYGEAIEAMQHKIIVKDSGILFYDEINILPKGDYYYPIEKEYQMINYIKAGDLSRAKGILEEVFDRNFGNRTLPVQTATCLMINMASTMIRALNEIGDERRDSFLKEFGPVETLLDCKTVNEMRSKMQEAIAKICTHAGKKVRIKHVIEKVISYVEKNYQDDNLSVYAIAENFGLNSGYLSKEFKEHAGIGLSDFIGKVRVEKAKQLLADRKTSLEQAAAMVGYTNMRTFTRAFAKNEGITPGKFRGQE